ncbi:MAG: DUF2232 domain-containing protein [Candidatus Goldiibacteriota bacterium]
MLESLIYLTTSFTVMFFFFGLTGFFMFFLIKKEMQWTHVIFAGVLCFMAVFTAFFAGVQKSTGHNIYEIIKQDFEKSTEEVLARAEKSGADPAEIKAMRRGLEMFFINALPAWIITAVVFIVFWIYFAARLAAVKFLDKENKMPPFSRWYIDEKMMWVLLLAMAMLAGGKFIQNETLNAAALNILFFLANLYFLAGLSVVVFYMEKKNVSGIVRLMFFMLAVFWSVVSAAVTAAGLFDTWFNFRKIEKGGTIWK